MAGNRAHIPQDSIPGLESYAPPIQLDRRNALARTLTPDYMGIKPGDYADITPEIMEHASVENLRPTLIDTTRKPSGSVSYYDPEYPRQPLWVALTPHEFGLLSGSVHMLGERAVSKSQEKRQTDDARQNPEARSRDQDAARRAGVHAVSNRAELVQRFLDNELTGKIELIEKFQKAAKNPGLSQFGHEITMRERFAYLQTTVFDDVFAALNTQRQWSSQQEGLARRAVTKRMFLDRANNQHLSYFKQFLNLAHEWNGYKRAVTAERLYQSKRYVVANQSSTSEDQKVQ